MFLRGITKTELLVSLAVMLIIVITDIVVIWHLNNKTYDVNVLSEVSQIRSGLEVFLQANNFYPAKTEVVELNSSDFSTQKLCSEGFKRNTENCVKNILNPVPNQYFAQGNIYKYRVAEDMKNYQLEFSLKTNFKDQGLLKGVNCVTNSQIFNQPCF